MLKQKPETAASLHASFQNDQPMEFEYKSSFIDGMGSPRVFPQMWKMAKKLLKGSLVVTLKDTANAIKLIAEKNKIIAEGAGAATVAAALNYDLDAKNIVCIISGGNIDTSKVIQALQGKLIE